MEDRCGQFKGGFNGEFDGKSSNLARQILAALATGGLDPTLPQALADAVLDQADEVVKLALQVRAGGADSMTAAVMLSFKIVSAATNATTTKADPVEAPEPVVPPKRSTVN